MKTDLLLSLYHPRYHVQALAEKQMQENTFSNTESLPFSQAFFALSQKDIQLFMNETDLQKPQAHTFWMLYPDAVHHKVIGWKSHMKIDKLLLCRPQNKWMGCFVKRLNFGSTELEYLLGFSPLQWESFQDLLLIINWEIQQ